MRKSIVSRFLLLGISSLSIPTACALDYSALLRSAAPDQVSRYAVFRDFQIKGICGTARLDMAARYGANTLRTYTPPTVEELDKYQRMGFRLIVGIWLPHQGENAGKDGIKWDFDYRRQGDAQLKNFESTVNRIGDHPAILMWCLGNEVPLDPGYLQTVNRMSLALHQKYPKQLASISIVNAPKEKIALIKNFAPDLDVIGYNSYGQGAVGGASSNLEQEWGRAYYVSEFGPQGPWWGRKTAWGEIYEQSYDAKLDDLRKSFEKIDAAPRCLGSTMFLWGSWTQQKPTYFSAFLNPEGNSKIIPDQDLYITPMAEEFCHYWSGKYPAERAPVLTRISIAGTNDAGGVIVQAGERFKVSATAFDSDTPASELRYRWWILDKSGKAVCGPTDAEQPTAELKAPDRTGTDYVVMAYVVSSDKRASGFTVPIKIDPARFTARNEAKEISRKPN